MIGWPVVAGGGPLPQSPPPSNQAQPSADQVRTKREPSTPPSAPDHLDQDLAGLVFYALTGDMTSMGLFDTLRGSSDDDDQDDSDRTYRICYKTDGGGWDPIDGYEDMPEPIDKNTFEYNAAPLDPGEYRLFEVIRGMNHQPEAVDGWTLQVEGDGQQQQTDDQEARELQALRAEIAELKDGDDPTDDIQQMIEKQKAAVGLQMLQNPEFIKRYGDKLALSIMDVDDPDSSSGVEMEDFETFSENPISASVYQLASTAAEDPETFEQLTETAGNSLGTLLAGAAQGATGGQQPQIDTPQQEADDTADDGTDTDDEQGREINAGPSDPSELVPDTDADATPDTDELAETIAASETAKREDEQTTEETTARREGPGTASGSGTDPMTAGPRHEPEGDPDPDRETAPTDDPTGEGISTVDDAAAELGEGDTEDTDDMDPADNGHDDSAEIDRDDAPNRAADVAEGL